LNWPSGVGLISTTNGSTLTLTLVTTGRPIYLWYRMKDSDGGTFTYALDGGATTTITTAPTTTISTQNGGVTGRGVVRITGVSAASHTIRINVTSPTSASNSVSIGGSGHLARRRIKTFRMFMKVALQSNAKTQTALPLRNIIRMH